MSSTLRELQQAKSSDKKIEQAIKELYNLIDIIDSANREIIKRHISYIIALLNNTLN